MDNIYFEKALETIHYRIIDGLPKDICNECPVVRMLGEITGMIKTENNATMASELGIESIALQCPCKKDQV